MPSLSQQIETLRTSLQNIDPGDLQSLAQFHAGVDAFIESTQEVDGISAQTTDSIKQLTGVAQKSLEGLILSEVTDTDQAIQGLQQSILGLQRLIQGGLIPDATLPGDSVEAARLVTQTTSPVATPPAPVVAAPAVAAAPRVVEPIAPRLFAEDELPLIQEFITEAGTHLDAAEQEMLALEEDPTNNDSLNALFRAFHTIKGVAGFLDLKQVQSLAHVAENLLDRGRSGQLMLTGYSAELVLKSIDTMKLLINAVATASTQGKPLAEVAGVDPLVVKLEDFLEGRATTAFESSDASATEAKATNDVNPASNTNASVASTSPFPARPAPPVVTAAPAETTASPDATKAGGDNTVKVATDRLDRLIDMVGELVIANSMVVQDLGEQAATSVRGTKNLSHMGKIVRELQDLSMSLRMVQVGTVFKKMSRLVRDTARKLCKDVELVIEGQETELDRNVVEALSDPLVHMVRNSVDHGIETPDQREAAGKPRTGKLTLRAYHKGGAINIEIIDDGRGLNRERIRRKAIANGLIEENAELSDADIDKLIFAAGLSTADKITDVSGRGVGMDVVRQNIEKLRGRIDISSEPGKGSKFTIRLPLTLAVIDGLVVKVGQEKYIIPINSIEQSIRPTPDMLSSVQGRGELVSVRGSILPLVRLHRLFGVEPRTDNPTESLVVIVQDSGGSTSNDRRACFLVDELLGQEQVVIKNLGPGMGQIRGISGGAVLGDGNVSLILDVAGVLDSVSH